MSEPIAGKTSAPVQLIASAAKTVCVQATASKPPELIARRQRQLDLIGSMADADTKTCFKAWDTSSLIGARKQGMCM